MANTSRTAIRRRARKPRRGRSKLPMYLSVGAIIIVFGFLIFAATRQREADAKTAPLPRVGTKEGDHWHAYLGVNVCGTWLDNAPEFEQIANTTERRNGGIHSHGDGLVHVHPFEADESGKNATLGKFISYGGWSLSDSSMKLWDNQTHKNGQDCPAGSNYTLLTAAASTSTTAPGSPEAPTTSTAPPSSEAQRAYIVWTVNGKPMKGNPASYRIKNGDVIAIGFLPKGIALTEPPNAQQALSNITDVPGAQVSGSTNGPAVPGSVPASVPVPAPAPAP